MAENPPNLAKYKLTETRSSVNLKQEETKKKPMCRHHNQIAALETLSKQQKKIMVLYTK